MATKYWVLELKGQRPVGELPSTTGKSGAHIVRVHFEGEATPVYLAADESQGGHVAETLKWAGTLKKVSAQHVTRLG